MTEQRDQLDPSSSSLLPSKTKWPDTAPLDGEELIFSISCGNSHLHWATHYGHSEDYNPQIFWRTPHLKEEDLQNEDLVSVLSRNLPDDPHDYIFGKAVDASAADALTQSQQRDAPLISVYVVSTNQGQEALLAKIWTTVPSRFFIMRGEDFFRKEEGRYDTMGTDRLATLTGAVHLHGHPALVFDGGTATTYSATDGVGKIMGGGIGPGIQSKFRALTKDTDALPEITSEEVIARVNEAHEKGKPLPTFARNTQEAMMADAFQEFALKGRNVIEHWLDKAYGNLPEYNDDVPEESRPKVNTDKRVLCTGGDGELLMQLLQPHYGGVIEHVESNGEGRGRLSGNGSIGPRYNVESSKHLIHYGIAAVLATQVNLRNSKEDFKNNPHEEHVGKRVAKHFEVEADDGDNIFRGKVVKVVEVEEGEHEFRIKYDDGDSEDVTSSELFDMFKLYATHGEKKAKKAAAPATAKGGKKKPSAKKAKKTKTPDDEKKTEDTSEPTNDKANGSLKGKKVDTKKAQKAKSPGKAADKSGASVEAVKSKTDKVLDGKKKADDAKKSKRAKSPVDAKKEAKPPKSTKNKAKSAPSQEKKPAAKKAKTATNVTTLVNTSDPKSFVRQRIAKDFDGETYFGTIMEYDDTETPAYWHVEYDDGDEEDYSKKDLITALKHYEVHDKKDANKQKP